MSFRKLAVVTGVLVLGLALAACHGSPKTPTVVTINSITLNPATASIGGVAQLSANISGAAASTVKTWSVSAGDLSLTQPDFAFTLRSTAKATSSSSVSTANSSVYWVAPAAPGDVTVTLTVGTATKTQTITVGASLVSMDVTDAAGGKKVATIKVNGVTDLYQAAFRVQFSGAWKPDSALAGPFLGTSSDVLFMGLTNQSGFVPVSLTRKGDVSGVDGSGTLATITFSPKSGASSARGASDVPFDVTMIVLRNSQNQPISNN